MTADEHEAAGTSREHRREVAAECVGRRLGGGVVRLRGRDGLSQQRGDAIEAALHARLPRAVGEQSRDANGRADLVPDDLHEGELALRERAVALDVDACLVTGHVDRDRSERERDGELVARDANDPFGVELGSQATHDLGRTLLAVERLGKRTCRPQPLERERRLGCNRLQDRELLRGELAVLVRRREREHADDTLLCDHRDPRAAARTDVRGKPWADERRRLDVVDRDRRPVEIRAGDPGRLRAQVDRRLRPPRSRLPRQLGVHTVRLPALLVDQHDAHEADAKELGDVSGKRTGDIERQPGP